MCGGRRGLSTLSARTQGIMVSSVKIMVARRAHDRHFLFLFSFSRRGFFQTRFFSTTLIICPTHPIPSDERTSECKRLSDEENYG